MPNFSVFPINAPSVPAGSHEMRDDFSNQGPPRSSPYTAPSITPYLGLRSRLSQVWLNRWTILLLLILARVLIACSGINNDLTSSRAQALSACSNVEAMGSAMASMPHYMSQGVNELTAAGIEKSVNALMQTTNLAVTGVEEIAVFVVNMMIGTYLCLISLAVNGSLHSVVSVLDTAQTSLNDLTKGLGNDMASVVSGFEDAYNAVKDTLKTATLGISSGIDLPDLNIDDDINKLRNLTLPSGLSDELKKLNNSIPDFSTIQDKMDDVIRLPFDQVKDLINGSLGNFTFDRSVFPVPQKEQLSFCSDNNGINGFFDELVGVISTAKKIFIGVLLVLAILVCIPMAYREIRRWRIMQDRAQLVGSHEKDSMDVVYIVSRPYTSSAGIKMSKGFHSERRQTLIRWVVAYATSEAALFVLALAIAGLFSCLCQYILLKSVEKEVPQLTNTVANFADEVVNKLTNASQQWAAGTNKAISDTNNTINTDMFGWVNTTTTSINDTLNQFIELTTETLNATFGGTILYDPVSEVFNCLVGLKVLGLERGLTWVNENAHINMPLLPNNTFTVGAAASISNDSSPDDSFLANPGDVASDQISNVVEKLILNLQDGIRTEALISTVVLLLYVLLVFGAFLRAMTLWRKHDKVRGDGGAAPYLANAQTIHPDFRSDQARHEAFEDIALDTTPHYTAPYTAPAPRYSTAVQEKTTHRADPEWDGDNKL